MVAEVRARAPVAPSSMQPAAAIRWIVAAAGVLMQLALGAIYGWSVFVTPLERLNGWTWTQVTLTFTIALFVLGLAAFAAGLWLERSGPQVVGVTAGITYGLGVFVDADRLGNGGHRRSATDGVGVR